MEVTKLRQTDESARSNGSEASLLARSCAAAGAAAPKPGLRGNVDTFVHIPPVQARLVARNSSVRVLLVMVSMLLGWAWQVPAQTESQQESEQPATRQEILRKRREEKRGQLVPYTVSRGEGRVRRIETFRLPRRLFVKGVGGFRPVVGGMPSGSGFVFGGGYISGVDSEVFQFTTNARYSTRGYTTFDVGADFPTSRSDLPVRAYVRAGSRDLTALNFFGLGPRSSEDNRTTFQFQDRTIEAGVSTTATRFFEVGAQGSWLTIETDSGSRGPSLEDRFDPSATPGFGEETDYVVYGGHAVVDLRDQEIPSAGVTLRVEAQRYDDRDTSVFDFTRLIGEVQAQIPLGYRNRILALRARTSHSTTESGGQVPFYLMETVGGEKSLRGFREYRFRDTRNLVLNAEYRWEIWTYVDFALFFDAGKVFSEADDLNFTDLRTGYGFGVRGHGPGGVVLRFDLARSSEGVKLHIGGGPRF